MFYLIAVVFALCVQASPASHSSSEIPNEPAFVTGEWSECSVTCGSGIRTRKVNCEIFMRISRTTATLPDLECPGIKPVSREACRTTDCVRSENLLMDGGGGGSEISNKIDRLTPGGGFSSETDGTDDDNDEEEDDVPAPAPASKAQYTWRSEEMTACSASCLGGTQESVIECISVRDGSVVSPYLCNIDDKPDSITRTCNNHPCPPRWRLSEYSACSKTCGGGVQTRTAQCIHEIARGHENAVEVPASQCEEVMPRSSKFCNVFDCEPKWVTEAWSSCSNSCDDGIKSRNVKCVREFALGQEIAVPSAECKEPQPPSHKPCNVRPCRFWPANTMIMAEDTLYVQKEPLKRLSLKIGGKAVVFEGTTVKIRCPRRRVTDNTELVQWFKDDRKLIHSAKLHFTGKHALRIKQVTFADAGTYACSVNSSRANLILSVKPDDTRRQGFVSQSVKKMRKSRKQSRKETIGANSTRNSLNPLRADWDGGAKFVADERKESGELKGETTSLSPSGFGFGVARSSATRSSREPITQLRQLLSSLRSSLSGSSPDSSTTVTPDQQLLPLMSMNAIDMTGGATRKVGDNDLAEDEVLDWLISDWSLCSQPCGATGVQVRGTQCVLRKGSHSKTVHPDLCGEVGLPKPDSLRDCHVECARWETSSWSECTGCVKSLLGLRTREVHCESVNGSLLSDEECRDSSRKPVEAEHCARDTCEAVWIPGSWTECQGSCEGSGMRSREVHCRWRGTAASAGEECDKRLRPVAEQTCKPAVCTGADCSDKSIHCNLARSLDMCKFEFYQKECCSSCGKNRISNTTTTAVNDEVAEDEDTD